ncbi:MAG: ATP-dependent helicase HrpB [Myxococcota bacterium]
MLPIHEVTDRLAEAVREAQRGVLLAPPGAGKTTVVPGLLVDRGLVEGQVWVLEPRRLAARLAAKRVAEERGGRVGDEVGYRVRFEDRSSKRTRILYVTEGILTRRLVQDPLLEGVGAVVLDEFHERSIHADLGLALLREVRTLRPELIVLVMSATLSPGPVANYLDDAPIVESQGRAHPVEISWGERIDERPVEDRVVGGVKRVLRDAGDGDVLAFLPGAREIQRAATRLTKDLEGKVDVLALHGEMDARAQDRAVRPREAGAPRRVVLATNVAESSLTIPGVEVVVDSGLAKRARFDPHLGVDHLELGRISRFSADQRAGRAGRLGPGRALRLWTEAEHRQLPLAEDAEVTRVDLAPALLQIVGFGSSPAGFAWFESPGAGRVAQASLLLERLGAFRRGEARLTDLGQRLARFPVHPRLGKMLLVAHERGVLGRGARLAALASERDLLRERRRGRDRVGSSDLLERLELLEEVERGASPESVGLDPNGARAVLRAAARLERMVGREPPPKAGVASGDDEEALLRATYAGYPDRVARARDGASLQLAEGGSVKRAEESVVKEASLVAVVQTDGRGSGRAAVARLLSRVEQDWLEEDGGVERETVARFDPVRERVEVVEVASFGRLELARRPRPNASLDPTEALVEAALAQLDRVLPVRESEQTLLRRYAIVREARPELELPELQLDALRRQVLPEVAMGLRSFAELRKVDLSSALARSLPSAARLDALAPTHVSVPSGRRLRLRYPPEGPPVLSVRLQEVFGLAETPRIAGGRVALKMELLAPNQRPVQVTQDLASFWARTYAEVRKELRRRYPKHQWPEDPADGIPSARAKPRRK